MDQQGNMSIEELALRNLSARLGDAELRCEMANAQVIYLQQELTAAKEQIAALDTETTKENENV